MVVSFNTKVLNGLCSDDQLELLNAVDQLRLQGIDHYISLPQIIVCGDQSSGKSSVLEAISGIPFPVKSNLCTRFPTELILRRSPHIDATVSIIPHKQYDRSRGPPSAFNQKLDGFDGLSDLIESAKLAMGISLQGQGFSKDLLRIEISGPQHPHLTIVDLPGLIHSETKQQSASDVELVRDVVETYMKQPRSIILAVVSAKNDISNQIVVKLARFTDPHGKRTLGVVTKPDTLVVGSGSEAMFVSLAENKEVEFDLGWHVLKNLDSEKVDRSSLLHRRNEEEEAFFSEGAWSQLPPSILGVKELRKRLSEVLLRQIATELPSLIKEIDYKLTDCRDRLHQLGQPRSTVHEQKHYLINISQKLQSLISDVKNGTYTDPFFARPKTNTGYEQRLRAVIQHLNREFAQEMKQSGHARTIISPGGQVKEGNEIARDQFVQEVQELMRRTRGRELPGRFNSLIVLDLFLEQSEPWKKIVISHIGHCWDAAKRCLMLATISVAGGSVGLQLLRKVIEPALNSLKEDIVAKASELIDSQVLCHPITYNEQYLEAVHRIHNQRRREFFSQVVEEYFGYPPNTTVSLHRSFNLVNLLDRLSNREEPDDEKFAASEAVDCMEAYYSVALKRIIDDVAIEVIERKLMTTLSTIFSPLSVFEMEDGLVSSIAGESQESRAKRAKLENQVGVLMKGSETCKRFAGVRLGDFVPSLDDGDDGIINGVEEDPDAVLVAEEEAEAPQTNESTEGYTPDQTPDDLWGFRPQPLGETSSKSRKKGKKNM
ncbi:putative dynamin family protein [Rosellinia necatrix]|uniref:Putative dynamin family protein n=1 Tax=Rosellinia necatrix TaxID=77044 RepID=A0A1W2TUH4_ROSNE|nr:putative dynamin family protein [Rosellinia necatrix]